MASRVDVFQLKVSLARIKPLIWRRLEVQADTVLGELHEIIQIAMGWTDSHLHEFQVGKARFGSLADEDVDRELRDEERVTLGMVTAVGSRFKYWYDFGDDWMHDIRVEKLSPPERGARYPRCIAGKRACPPEDCGGPFGYAALVDPRQPDHRMRAEWYGKPFDAERFDLAAVNAIFEPPPPPRPPRVKDRARSTPRRLPRSPSSRSARSP